MVFVSLPFFVGKSIRLTIITYYSLCQSNFDEGMASFGEILTERTQNTFGQFAKPLGAMTQIM